MTDDQVLKAIRAINERLNEQKTSYDEVRCCYAMFLINMINAQMAQAPPSEGLETIARYLQQFADIQLIDSELKGTDPFSSIPGVRPALIEFFQRIRSEP